VRTQELAHQAIDHLLLAGDRHESLNDKRPGSARWPVLESPTDVGSSKAREEKAPLSEISEVLNGRFGSQFTEEDRLFFQQIKEKACKDQQVIETALGNPLDNFAPGIQKPSESFKIERMTENDQIVTRYIGDRDFQSWAFPILAREIFDTVRTAASREASGQSSR